MKNLIVYYSYTGNVKRLAQQLAKATDADLAEVNPKKRPGTVGAYVAGSFAAMRQKTTEIEPIAKDLNDYDEITVIGPIWAGNPAPAINNIFAMLPPGKQVTVQMVSASGNSSAMEKVKAQIESRGCTLKEYKNVNSGNIPQ